MQKRISPLTFQIHQLPPPASGPPILEYACESFWFLSAWGEYLEYKGEEDEEVSESDVFLQEFQLPKM
jgi:hypothetical protein